MLLRVEADARRWGTVWRQALELGLTLAQNVRAGVAFMAANVANGYGTREGQNINAHPRSANSGVRPRSQTPVWERAFLKRHFVL